MAVGLLLPTASARAQSPSPAAGLPPGIGIGLLEAPSNRAEDPRAQRWIIDHVAAGTSFERRFEVVNGTGEPVVLDLYAVGADIVDGVFTPFAARERNDLAGWITVTPAEVALEPGGRAEGSMRLEVPPGTVPGERYAAVLAERPPEAVAGGGVGVASRVGIRVYLSVGEGAEPVTDFAIESLTAQRREDGSPVVEATVANTGGRALDFTGELILGDGPGGLTAGPFAVTTGTSVAPGDRTPVEVVLDPALPEGPWRAQLVLRSGMLERAAEATITFPEEPDTAAPPVAADASPPVADPDPRGRGQLLTLAGSLLLFALLMLAITWWGRRRNPDAARAYAEGLRDWKARRRAAREQEALDA